MRLTDTLFYWLQTKLMTESRPEDGAALDSLAFFAQILSEDHGVASMEVDTSDAAKIYVTYRENDSETKTLWFDREAAEQLRNELYGLTAELDDEDYEVN